MLNTLLCLATLAPAHDTAVDTARNNVDLEEAKVVEFKLNKRNLAPSSVSVLGRHFLRDQEVVNIKELTAVLPNFYMPDYGSKQNSPIYIRGIGAKAKGPTVAFNVDGVPHFENSSFDLDLAEVGSVEVFRGPQGTLFGRNAIGGTINVHSLSPLAYQGTRLKLGAGTQADRSVQLAHYARLSSNFGFSLSGGYHHNGGCFRNVALDRKADALDEGFGRLALVWKPAAGWTLRLNSFLDHTDQGGYPYAAYDPASGRTAEVNYNRPSTYRRTISSSGFGARYENETLSFNSQTAFQYVDDRQTIDQDFTPADLYYVINTLGQKMLSQELTLKSNHAGRYQWVVGAFGMRQWVDNTVETQYIVQDRALPAHYEIPTTALALYHQSSFNLWRGLSLTAGLRFDYEHARDDYSLVAYRLSAPGLRKPVSTFDSRLHFHQLTPKFAFQYITRNRNLYYVSVTRGYKAGGFNQTFRTDDERTYAPEFNWNYELGSKLRLLDGRLLADLAVFYIDWRRQQVSHTVPGKGNILLNAGHSDSKGVELALTARPIPTLVLHANYGYTYARFIDYKKSAAQDFSHHLLPLVPRHTLSLNAAYSLLFDGGLLKRLTLSTGLTGVGKIYWAEDNAVAQPFYALLNAKVSADFGHLSWEVWGKNLTDTHYNVYAFKAPTHFAQLGRPLSLGTSLILHL